MFKVNLELCCLQDFRTVPSWDTHPQLSPPRGSLGRGAGVLKLVGGTWCFLNCMLVGTSVSPPTPTPVGPEGGKWGKWILHWSLRPSPPETHTHTHRQSVHLLKVILHDCGPTHHAKLQVWTAPALDWKAFVWGVTWDWAEAIWNRSHQCGWETGASFS